METVSSTKTGAFAISCICLIFFLSKQNSEKCHFSNNVFCLEWEDIMQIFENTFIEI